MVVLGMNLDSAALNGHLEVLKWTKENCLSCGGKYHKIENVYIILIILYSIIITLLTSLEFTKHGTTFYKVLANDLIHNEFIAN